jgi:hypothetical protein
LLSTPSRDDAVTFGYRERASPERGLTPLRSRLLAGARIPAFAGMTKNGAVRLFAVSSKLNSYYYKERAYPFIVQDHEVFFESAL